MLIDAQAGNKYYIRVNVGWTGSKLEKAENNSIFKQGTFSNASLVKIINFDGKGLAIK